MRDTTNDDLFELSNAPLSPLDLPAEEEIPLPDPEEMLILLQSDLPMERMQAARVFCELEDARAIPRLIQLLNDDCPLVRVSAAYALGRNKSKVAIEPLIQQFHQDWNGYVRKGVVWALGTCHDSDALDCLINALTYDIPAVRLWAASALGQLGDIKAIAAVTQALNEDKMSAVRANCAWALGKLLMCLLQSADNQDDLYHDAVDALIHALNDDDLSVVADARTTLRRVADPRGLKVLDRIEIEQGYCEF
ncbi:MAG: HEAT repeat domain-containing protein [Pseudanabaenaceae cyanobacterium]|jgi:HEAT repeat protein